MRPAGPQETSGAVGDRSHRKQPYFGRELSTKLGVFQREQSEERSPPVASLAVPKLNVVGSSPIPRFEIL